MGASKSQSMAVDPTLHAEQFDELNNCGMYRNSKGKQFEKYRVQNYGFNDFVTKYQYRIKNPHQFLVNAYFIKEVGNTFGCSVTDLYDVVIERVQYRLSDFTNLSWYESVDLMKGALKGFHELYGKVGLFLIKDTMIGVDKDNQVKVWLNPKFQLNSLETQPLSFSNMPEEDRQATMVDNIFQLVDLKSKKEDLWLKFVRQWQQIKPTSFKHAIEFVQNFIQSHSKASSIKIQQNNIDNMDNTSKYTISNSVQYHQFKNDQNRNKTKQTQSQSQTQSRSFIQYDPNLVLTKSIDLRTTHIPIEQNQQPYIHPNDGKIYGFASLRNRAIHNIPIQNIPNHPPQIYQPVFNVSGMPPMPTILQSRHPRVNEIKQIPITSRYKYQPLMNNLSQSCQILPIMRSQPQMNIQQPRHNVKVLPQPMPIKSNKETYPGQLATNHVRSFSQETKFPEPRHAVQIIKPNKTMSRLNSNKKQEDKQAVIQQTSQEQKNKDQAAPEICNNQQAVSQVTNFIPKQKQLMVSSEKMSQSRRLREPGKIKYQNQKMAQSRSISKAENKPEISASQPKSDIKAQINTNINTNTNTNSKVQLINTKISQQLSQLKPEPQKTIQKFVATPQIPLPEIEKPKQININQQKPNTKRLSQTPQFKQDKKIVKIENKANPPQKLERSLSTSVKIIENIQKQIQMSRVSRLSRTNSQVNNSISYRDLRSLLQSVHRKNRN